MENDFIKFIEKRLAVGEGGDGDIRIGWDDATRDYIITQKNLNTNNHEILGCSRSLRRAIELAITGKKYDE